MSTDSLSDTLSVFEKAYFEMLQAEETLKEKKAIFRMLSENDVPEAMEAAAKKTAKTPSGYEVKLGDEVYGSAARENIQEAIAWIKDTGVSKEEREERDGLLKYVLTFTFGMKQGERARDVRAALLKTFPDMANDIKFEPTIHGSTLKSFVTKQLRQGVPLPSFFGVFAPRAAKIIPPKAPLKEAVYDDGQLYAGLGASIDANK